MTHYILFAYIITCFICVGVGLYCILSGDGAVGAALISVALAAAGVQITLLVGYKENGPR